MAGASRSGTEVASTSGVGPARTVRDIAKELRALVQSPPEGIRLLLSGDDADCISTVQVELDGPAGTPYDGGVFRMKLEFGADFPGQPPKGYFLTRIFHPNISKTGEICVNTLKRDWKPNLGLRHVLLVVRCLLIEPYPESALNEEAGKMLLDDYAEYAHHARLMTSIHAMPRQAAQQRHTSAGSGAASASSATQGPSGPAGSSPTAGGGEAGSPGSAQAATPLALNSSIANDGHASARAGGDSGRGVAGDGAAADLAAGGIKGAGNTGAKDKLKKVDSRKKSLKRL